MDAENAARAFRGRRQSRRVGVRRTHRHVVRVTPEVEEQLLARAARMGNISVPRLLVESALAGSAEAAERDAARRAALAAELYRQTRLLGKIGVNVNQIARATNASGEVQADTSAALRALERACGRLESWLDDVERS